jgi:hypothetical protein
LILTLVDKLGSLPAAMLNVAVWQVAVVVPFSARHVT